ncbi:MAG: fimbrillin family protein [Bacteroidales bacterium]|nr:fimbrillin family protein [Bacteroidales bacterium]
MKRILYIVFALFLICACDKQNNDLNQIRFNIGFPATKATSTAFEAGDELSLYAVEYEDGMQMPLQIGGNYLNNEKVVYDGNDWAGARTLYWSDKPCDFYALYPYQAEITSVDQYPFSVAQDQNGTGYEASDLLFAKVENVAQSAGVVDLHFKHMMSKCVVEVVKGATFEGVIPDDIVCHIYNTCTSCKVDCVAGTLEKDPFGAKKTITMNKLSNTRFEAVVVPQNIENRTPLIELTMGGIAYLLDYSLSFRPGYVHTITVNVNTSPDQEMIEISIDPGIDDWN